MAEKDKKTFFDLEKVEAQADQVDVDERWFPLEGRRFGDTASLPLKVKVASGGEAWQRGWTKGAQAYAKGLSPSERRRFNENATNPLTIDAPALPRANRAAIRESGALLAVALVGPIIDDPDGPLPPDVAEAYGMKSLPKEIRELYRLMTDGRWMIPVQVDPPEAFVASAEQIDRLLKYPDFVNQVGNCRRLLVEEGAEGLEEELGNFVGGSGTPDGGPGSPEASEPASKS